jgi:hypothetical protein
MILITGGEALKEELEKKQTPAELIEILAGAGQRD